MSKWVAVEADRPIQPNTLHTRTTVLSCPWFYCHSLFYPPWLSVFAQGLQHPYVMYIANKFDHLLWFPTGGRFQLVFVAFPLSASFPLARRKLCVELLFLYSVIWHALRMSGPAQL